MIMKEKSYVQLEGKGFVGEETLRKAFELQRIGNRAVKKAQEENRKLGIPNWYSINGIIISDQEILQISNARNTDDNEESTTQRKIL